MKETLYGFYYNSCIHESAYGLMSIHRSIEGAQKALDKHVAEKKLEFKSYEDWCKKEGMGEPKFGAHEDWVVREITIED